ncbi:P-loop containing nucleoside triphosphate hydrolase protein [Lasiosphaeris hirsuta]|uniref:P-loop containing nucleoside triphosphate hydrolase protein n=1 Tax=Lasiosphaeris hirsuta TaxID=260670 RepID=A0AA40DTX3_9PEZI|nr:P-loop containing nucleoside triphosphate hydrolase protein [Lasiosphaeris hirsuta]
MSGVDDYYRTKISSRNPDVGQGAISGPRSRGPRSTSRGVGADSSGCSDGECGIQPEVFDSDLESEIGDVGKATHAKKMRKWKSLAKGKFEKMLLECIVNTEEIPPDYGNMYVDPKVIGKLERVTRMSLLRPKAFGHGVLAGNRVTGAVLWGPPGTGKSLLAKGVARQSNFNMILASTAELWQKCHGDDEKVITALFSMARKIHPTIVFIDEADAMLGSRKAGEKRHIRSMMNQFLMEWDGLKSGKDAPFILLATNRPFDLDPAVLRRAPMQIHLDIPTAAQRRGILDLILKKETLAPDVSIEKLVKLTPRYTGSDLKNMCVTAATECVWEMEEDSKERTLYLRHFKSAMVNIKATGLSKTMEHELRSFGRNEKPGTQPRRQEDE